MNKEQEELVDEVYDKYITKYMGHEDIPSKDLFIFEIKTNPDFSEKWGLKIEERELSRKERSEYYYKHGNSEGIVEGSLDRPTFKPNDEAHKWYDDRDVPTRAISLMWNQRSCDLFLGIPFNIASYGLLLEIIAKEVNMVPEELIGNLGDVHLYNNHIEQAKEQITRTPYELPKLNIKLHFNNKPSFVPEHWLVDDFVIENYQSHPTIKAPLSN